MPSGTQRLLSCITVTIIVIVLVIVIAITIATPGILRFYQVLGASSFISQQSPMCRHGYPHCTQKETRAQTGEVTCPRSQSKQVAEPELFLRLFESNASAQNRLSEFRTACRCLLPGLCSFWAECVREASRTERLPLSKQLLRLCPGTEPPCVVPGFLGVSPHAGRPLWLWPRSGHVLGACVSAAEALDLLWLQTRVAIGLSGIP